MDLDYNFLADTDEDIVYPMIWKNSVDTILNISNIVNPIDGECRKIDDTENWYQYSRALDSWNQISKVATSNFSYHKIAVTLVVTIPTNQQMTVHNDFILEGDLIIQSDAQLVIT